MKKILISLVALVAMSLGAYAQKFAMVDMEYILKNIPAYEMANEQINQQSLRWEKEVEELSKEEEQAQLTAYEKAIVKQMKKEFKDLEVIPADEYQAYGMLLAKAAPVWEEAKNTNNYSIFCFIIFS